MFRSEGRKRGGFGPLNIFRLLLSLIMFAVLGLGAYQAFKYFSGDTLAGPDLLNTDPKAALISLITSEDSAKVLFGLLGFELKDSSNSSALGVKSTTVSNSKNTSGGEKSVLKFAVVTDSHNDNVNLGKALEQAKAQGVKLVIGLGDYSATGTLAELKAAKLIFELSGLPYYLTAGDHDLWESREKDLAAESNFTKVFGTPYQSFVDSNIRFVIVYNSDNYGGVDDLQMSWLEDALSQDTSGTTFVFLHEPLVHPTADRVMGKTTPKLLSQAQKLIALFDEAGVSEVFAGDIHAFSRYSDDNSGLKMVTAGAVTKERNLQLPRYLMVDVLEDGSYNIEDLEVKD